VGNEQTEKISDKRMYWRVANITWVITAVCFFVALGEGFGMTGWKAVAFIGLPMVVAIVFTISAVKSKESEKSEKS